MVAYLGEYGINAKKLGKGALQRMYSEIKNYTSNGDIPARLLALESTGSII